MKKSRLKPISDKRRADFPREIEERIKLGIRCGGTWEADNDFPYGGYFTWCKCEICHLAGDWRGIQPHEPSFHSKKRKVSLETSLMLCQRCHDHIKYPKSGTPLSVEEQLELIRKLNESFVT